jgi:ADP-heptose:LPS heptosyltransferase
MPLDAFLPLMTLPCHFYSLQKEVSETEQQWLNQYAIQNGGSSVEDFADTAALLSQMDIVISVDTAVAHLAGALGRPVWILLSTKPDWRWMLDREDSPWYPTARLFRQTTPNEWSGVVERVKRKLLEQFFT